MDEQVLRSLIKWPDVPDCFGWLALDRRGQWRMRDEFAQQHHLPGQTIHHRMLSEFISRNYACDQSGRYFFQNGPQRVFITLDATPWIARFQPSELGQSLVTQCHQPIIPSGALSDEKGNIYITGSVNQTLYEGRGNEIFSREDLPTIALLHDHDLDYFSELANIGESTCSFGGSWQWHGKELPLDPTHSKDLPTQYHFVMNPKA